MSLVKSIPAEIVSALILKVTTVDPRAEGRREEENESPYFTRKEEKCLST